MFVCNKMGAGGVLLKEQVGGHLQLTHEWYHILTKSYEVRMAIDRCGLYFFRRPRFR